MTGFNTFAADSSQDLTMVLPPGSLCEILGPSIRVWVVLASRGRILINTPRGLEPSRRSGAGPCWGGTAPASRDPLLKFTSHRIPI